MRVVELTSSLAGNEDVEIYTTASAMQNYRGFDGEEEGYSNLFKGLKKSSKERQKRKLIKTKAKAQAKTTRADAKKTSAQAKKGEAVAKQLSAKASEAGVAGDIALAGALKSDGATTEKKGLSTGAWIGIGVGAVVVIGGIIFAVVKSKK
jgi:hypothetical protein